MERAGQRSRKPGAESIWELQAKRTREVRALANQGLRRMECPFCKEQRWAKKQRRDVGFMSFLCEKCGYRGPFRVAKVSKTECKGCGKLILWKYQGDRWIPFDPDGTRHDCAVYREVDGDVRAR